MCHQFDRRFGHDAFLYSLRDQQAHRPVVSRVQTQCIENAPSAAVRMYSLLLVKMFGCITPIIGRYEVTFLSRQLSFTAIRQGHYVNGGRSGVMTGQRKIAHHMKSSALMPELLNRNCHLEIKIKYSMLSCLQQVAVGIVLFVFSSLKIPTNF